MPCIGWLKNLVLIKLLIEYSKQLETGLATRSEYIEGGLYKHILIHVAP
jgi:hypothetical protein